jgi:hypothetical protein
MGKIKTRQSFAAALVALGATLAGCGGEGRGYLDGVVKLNGQPVGPGTISLEPVEGKHAGAMASFGEDGRYSIVSAGRKEGAPPGEYRVLIHGGADFGTETGAPQPASKIPARYSQPSTSDLKITLQPGRQSHDFDLKP